jgi:hypothetical protein
MQTYVFCASIGIIMLIARLLLGVFYFGGLDAKYEEAATRNLLDYRLSVYHQVLSMLTYPLAFLGAYGLAGAVMLRGGWEEPAPRFFGLGAGVLAVAPFLLLERLGRRSTIHLEKALNRTATVCETIPAQRAGAGSIVVEVLSRRIELAAVTDGAEIPAGAQVVVRAIVDRNTVEVLGQNFEDIWRQAKPG